MLPKSKRMLIWVPWLAIWPLFIAHANAAQVLPAKSTESSMRISLGYLWPRAADRDIRTVNLNFDVPVKSYYSARVIFSAGLTATCASGTITQLEGELAEGTLRRVNSENEAIGLGPVLRADLCVWCPNRLALYLSASVGLILYNQDFPAGGDRYNFMWRIGPAMRYKLMGNVHLGMEWQWMHVSNGQGSGAQNPSYDAQGISVNLSFGF